MSNFISQTSDGGDFDRIYMTSNSLFNMYLANTTQATNSLYTNGYGAGTANTLYGTYTNYPFNPYSSVSSPVLSDSKYGWKKIAGGQGLWGHHAGIKQDNTLLVWGDGTTTGYPLPIPLNTANGYWLGDGTLSPRSSPVTIAGGGSWSNVAVSGIGGCAVKTDGTVWSWGYNYNGYLGNNNSSLITTLSPVSVSIGAGNTFTSVVTSASDVFNSLVGAVTLGIQTGGALGGTLWSWGSNVDGQLGDGTTSNRSSPVTVIGFPGTTWTQVAVGTRHAIGIQPLQPRIWAWGRDTAGQVGQGGAGGIYLSPVTVVGLGFGYFSSVAAGGENSAAIDNLGRLWIWGDNQNGQLGNGATNFYGNGSPVTVAGGGTDWKQIAFDSSSSTMALKTNGTLWGWGDNYYGQLGDGTTSNRSSPVSLVNFSGNTWSSIAAGAGNFHAIRHY